MYDLVTCKEKNEDRIKARKVVVVEKLWVMTVAGVLSLIASVAKSQHQRNT